METCDGRHCCEPPTWPTVVGETWSCGECGRSHRSVPVEDMHLSAFMLEKIPAGTIGWTSRPVDKS